MKFPHTVPNIIDGQECMAATESRFEKYNPADGTRLFDAARSDKKDIDRSVGIAVTRQSAWADTPAVARGCILHDIVIAMKERREEIAAMVAAETGKSHAMALGETDGAIQLGLFYASEGQRLYGRTTTSGIRDKYSMTIREPVGVAGLITAANTPIANVAWKVFPALICGNSVVLKSAEDAPGTAWLFGAIAHGTDLPTGVFNIVNGYGREAGAPLVEHPQVDVISFTGSTHVGRIIAQKAAERLVKVSLELGGKNPLVVCDDADLEHAAQWAILSAFSNAGQRCSSGSRVLIFDKAYDKFKELLIEKTNGLKVGTADDDDLGPVINEKQLTDMIATVGRAKAKGAAVLTGGKRLNDGPFRGGYYMAPTLIEGVGADDEISIQELFGPIACLYRVTGYKEAVDLANRSPYGLTACIHTKSTDRAIRFCHQVQAGTTVINGGTYGSEPHMPFGGVKQSGNGTREPGTEALDIYSNLKSVNIHVNPNQL